jgi:hypothetical protein
VPASYVTQQELRTNLGIGTLYSNNDVEEVCQAAQDLIEKMLWFNDVPVIGASVSNDVATITLASPGMFVTGQQITVSECGSPYNGSHTITGSFPGSTVPTSIGTAFLTNLAFSNNSQGYSIVQFSVNNADEAFHFIKPYGRALGPDTQTASYATTPAIRQAAMIVAVDIWQARQVSQTGGVGMDGVSASPYRMGYQLINRVRGLIQPYSAPNSLVG